MHLLIPGQATRTAGCLQSRRQTSTLKVSGGSGESADPPFLSTLPNAPLSRLRPPCFCSLVPLYKFPFKLPHKQLESQKKKLSRQHKPEQRNENTTRNAKQIKHIYHISHWNDGTFFDLLCNGSFFFPFFFLEASVYKENCLSNGVFFRPQMATFNWSDVLLPCALCGHQTTSSLSWAFTGPLQMFYFPLQYSCDFFTLSLPPKCPSSLTALRLCSLILSILFVSSHTDCHRRTCRSPPPVGRPISSSSPLHSSVSLLCPSLRSDGLQSLLPTTRRAHLFQSTAWGGIGRFFFLFFLQSRTQFQLLIIYEGWCRPQMGTYSLPGWLFNKSNRLASGGYVKVRDFPPAQAQTLKWHFH